MENFYLTLNKDGKFSLMKGRGKQDTYRTSNRVGHSLCHHRWVIHGTIWNLIHRTPRPSDILQLFLLNSNIFLRPTDHNTLTFRCSLEELWRWLPSKPCAYYYRIQKHRSSSGCNSELSNQNCNYLITWNFKKLENIFFKVENLRALFHKRVLGILSVL